MFILLMFTILGLSVCAFASAWYDKYKAKKTNEIDQIIQESDLRVGYVKLGEKSESDN